MSVVRARWKPGWSTARMEALSSKARIRREARIAAKFDKPLLHSTSPSARFITIDVDTTKNGQPLKISDLAGIVGPIARAADEVEAVVLKPPQRARAPWRGDAASLKAHKALVRKLARRHRLRGDLALAEGLLAGLRYHPEVEVSVTYGTPDITGGVDRGEKSSYQTVKLRDLKDLTPLRKDAWASLKVVGPHSVGTLAWKMHDIVTMMVLAGTLPHASRFIRVVLIEDRSKEAIEVTMRDWGRPD